MVTRPAHGRARLIQDHCYLPVAMARRLQGKPGGRTQEHTTYSSSAGYQAWGPVSGGGWAADHNGRQWSGLQYRLVSGLIIKDSSVCARGVPHLTHKWLRWDTRWRVEGPCQQGLISGDAVRFHKVCCSCVRHSLIDLDSLKNSIKNHFLSFFSIIWPLGGAVSFKSMGKK